MEGFFVEVKEEGYLVLALDVPVLDCVRIPGPLGMPNPIQWKHDGPGRFAAEHTAVLGQFSMTGVRHYELTARVHS